MEKKQKLPWPESYLTSVLDLYLHSKTHRIVTPQNNTKMLPKFLAAPPPPLLSGHLSCGSGPRQPSRQASASTRAAQRSRSGGRHDCGGRLPPLLCPPATDFSCLLTQCQPLCASCHAMLLYFSRYCTVRVKMFSLFFYI